MTIDVTLSPFPDPAPNIQTQTQTEFSANADSFVSHLITEFPNYNTFATQANALASTVNTDATTASNAATAAGTSETNAASSEANALSYLNMFRGQYYGALASDPTLDPIGNPIGEGDIYWNTTTHDMLAYDGASWVSTNLSANSALKIQNFTATSGQTNFTVAGGYTPSIGLVVRNGATLVNGSDVTITSGTEFVLTVGATAGDELTFIGFGSFNVANTNTIAEIDAKDTAAAVYGNYSTYGGTANAITLSSIHVNAPTALVTGAAYRFRATATNTGATTINPDGLGAIAAKTITGVDLPAGYIRTDVDTIATYDGTNFIVDRQIERGSNANGDYIRFADGTMICTHSTSTLSTTQTTGYTLLYSNKAIMTFPSTFSSIPSVTYGVDSNTVSINFAGSDGSISTSGFGVYLLSGSTIGTTSGIVRYNATGYWY